MCIILDSCCIPKVLNPKNQEHDRFSPVRKWINSSKGQIAYGGSKYKNELKNMGSFLQVFLEYKKMGKLKLLDDEAVDKAAAESKRIEGHRLFNDEHLVGMILVSRCKVVCTDDTEAIPFLKKHAFYKNHKMRPPKIYSNQRHSGLLSKLINRDKYSLKK